MPRKPEPQLSLFGDGPAKEPAAAPAADLAALARRVPPRIRLGTSSWTFPGWQGLVYHKTYSKRAFTRDSLEEYARHPLFRTVGLDSTYYAPPRPEILAHYATQLPEGFPAVSKVWDRLTLERFPPHRRYGRDAGKPNPHYLDAALFEEAVLRPFLERFREHMGPFVFAFPPLRASQRPPSDEFAGRLDEFLGRLPSGPRYAVEIRNREILSPKYLAALRRHGAGHVLNQWSFMPPIGRQAELEGIFTAPFTLVRLLLRPGTRYEERRKEMEPFDRIVDPDPEMRRDVARLALRAEAEELDVYVLVNNKAEGCAPLTVQALAEAIAGEREAEPF